MKNMVERNLEMLKNSLVPMEKQEKELDRVDAVIGRPEERLIPRELLISAPEEWNFFPKASIDKIKEISTSIRQYGLFHNITVWEQEDGTYMILGGHTRVACFDYLASPKAGEDNPQKWTKIPALVYKKKQITDVDAQRIIIVSNIDQREVSRVIKAKAYMALYRLEKEKSFYGSHRSTLQATADVANVSRNDLHRHLCLLNLNTELQELVSYNKIPFMVGYHLSFLGEGLQRYVYDNRLFENMSYKTAEQIKTCTTTKAIDDKLYRIKNATKYYKYTYQTKRKKSNGEEVLPIVVEKNRRLEVAELLVSAVAQSKLSEADKKRLTNYLDDAKLYL